MKTSRIAFWEPGFRMAAMMISPRSCSSKSVVRENSQRRSRGLGKRFQSSAVKCLGIFVFSILPIILNGGPGVVRLQRGPIRSQLRVLIFKGLRPLRLFELKFAIQISWRSSIRVSRSRPGTERRLPHDKARVFCARVASPGSIQTRWPGAAGPAVSVVRTMASGALLG